VETALSPKELDKLSSKQANKLLTKMDPTVTIQQHEKIHNTTEKLEARS